MQTLKQKIEALPEPERSARRAFYSDTEWVESWELNAFPFQMEPPGDQWTYWTIVAPPKTGKSYAGSHWAWEKFQTGGNVLCVFRHPNELTRIFSQLHRQGILAGWSISTDTMRGPNSSLRIRNKVCGNTMYGTTEESFNRGSTRGMNFDYVWADEIYDAETLAAEYPLARKYLFTQPVRVHPKSLVTTYSDKAITFS